MSFEFRYPFIDERYCEATINFIGSKAVTKRMMQDIKNFPGFIEEIRKNFLDEINKSSVAHQFDPHSYSRKYKKSTTDKGYSLKDRNELIVSIAIEDTLSDTVANIHSFLDEWAKRKSINYIYTE